MIIGVTNLPCSGADSVGRILSEKGFIWLSYSDILREELRKNGKEINRETLRGLANELRKREGTGVLSKRLLQKIDNKRDYVFGTIRNPGEIHELRKTGNFILMHIEAPTKIRFERMLSRNRENDPKTFGDFLALEAIELKDNVAEGLQIAECIKMADYKIVNDSSLEDLGKKVDELLMQLSARV